MLEKIEKHYEISETQKAIGWHWYNEINEIQPEKQRKNKEPEFRKICNSANDYFASSSTRS